MFEVENLETQQEFAQAKRSNMYRFIAEAWKYPHAEFVELIRDGSLGDGVRKLVDGLPYEMEFPARSLGGMFMQDVSQESFEAEYIRVFEVGPGGPPCQLQEGSYLGSKQSVMQELVRFYNYFGLSTVEGLESRLPDDLTVELEFMHYLTFKEIVAAQQDEDPAPYRRAEHDFLDRHLTKWLSTVSEKLDGFIAKDYKKVDQNVLIFYQGLIQLTEEFCRKDLEYLHANPS